MEEVTAIKVDRRRVLLSGSLVVELNQAVSIRLRDDGDEIIVIFKLVKPQAGDVATPDIHYEVISPSTASFTIKNFDNPLGTGLVPAEKLATLGKGSLFVGFLVHAVTSIRLLTYTFTVEDPQ